MDKVFQIEGEGNNAAWSRMAETRDAVGKPGHSLPRPGSLPFADNIYFLSQQADFLRSSVHTAGRVLLSRGPSSKVIASATCWRLDPFSRGLSALRGELCSNLQEMPSSGPINRGWGLVLYYVDVAPRSAPSSVLLRGLS